MESEKMIMPLRMLGMFWLIVGIITALLDFHIGAFTPMVCFVLMLASFIGVICNVLFKILDIMKSKQASK